MISVEDAGMRRKKSLFLKYWELCPRRKKRLAFYHIDDLGDLWNIDIDGRRISHRSLVCSELAY